MGPEAELVPVGDEEHLDADAEVLQAVGHLLPRPVGALRQEVAHVEELDEEALPERREEDELNAQELPQRAVAFEQVFRGPVEVDERREGNAHADVLDELDAQVGPRPEAEGVGLPAALGVHDEDDHQEGAEGLEDHELEDAPVAVRDEGGIRPDRPQVAVHRVEVVDARRLAAALERLAELLPAAEQRDHEKQEVVEGVRLVDVPHEGEVGRRGAEYARHPAHHGVHRHHQEDSDDLALHGGLREGEEVLHDLEERQERRGEGAVPAEHQRDGLHVVHRDAVVHQDEREDGRRHEAEREAQPEVHPPVFDGCLDEAEGHLFRRRGQFEVLLVEGGRRHAGVWLRRFPSRAGGGCLHVGFIS